MDKERSHHRRRGHATIGRPRLQATKTRDRKRCFKQETLCKLTCDLTSLLNLQRGGAPISAGILQCGVLHIVETLHGFGCFPLGSFIGKRGQVFNTVVIEFASERAVRRLHSVCTTKKKNVTLSNYERYSAASRLQGIPTGISGLARSSDASLPKDHQENPTTLF